MYAVIIGFEENLIGNKIMFLFDGSTLNHDSNEKLQTKFVDGCNIVVFDSENIIESLKNISFNTSTSISTKIKADKKTTIENLYKEEIDIYENANKEELIYLFNGLKLDPHSKETIEKIIKSQSAVILVEDPNGIILN